MTRSSYQHCGRFPFPSDNIKPTCISCSIDQRLCQTHNNNHNNSNSHRRRIITLLWHPASWNFRNDDNETRLRRAARHGRVHRVRVWLQHGTNLYASDQEYGWTPLHWASFYGHEEVVTLLLQWGAHPFAKDNRGRTPLYLATAVGHYSVMKILLDHPGTDVNTEDDDGQTPLQVACENGHDESIVNLLLEHGARFDHFIMPNRLERILLHLASMNGHLAFANFMLDYGVDVNARDRLSWTPLHYASNQCHEAVVKCLLEHGADANARDSYGWRPLHWACHPRVDMDGRELLQVPSPKEDDAVVIRLLLENGAWTDSTTDNAPRLSAGETALHIACQIGYVAGMKCLLEYGANSEAVDFEGSTALHRASEKGQVEAAALLVEYGANINARNRQGRTPLHLSCQNNQTKVTELLLEHGANVDAKDSDGWSPRNLAANNGHHEVTALLLEYINNGRSMKRAMQKVVMDKRYFIWL